ncbi:MAG TPA: PQQ-binding-like beta-propeller repeat protein [Verrucomicrobiae bacterium]
MLTRALLAAVLLTGPYLFADDWPCFRGPHHDGISREKLPSPPWTGAAPKELWRASVGLGFSTMVVADGKVIATGHDGKKQGIATIWCFDATSGAVTWKHSYAAPLGDMYFEGGTTGTPTIHEGKVFHLSREGDVACLDLATGGVRWQKPLAKELEATMPDWGYAGSPLVDGERLILNVGGAGTALDRATGRVVWKSTPNMAAYATPVPFDLGGKPCVALLGHKECLAVERAAGSVLWRQKFVSGYNTSAGAPVVHAGTIFVSAYNVPAVMLDARSGLPVAGWKTDTRVHFNAGVVIGGHLYAFHGEAGKKEGELRCLDWKTGSTKWAQKGLGVGSLIAADGKLICFTDTGELVITEASPEKFKPLTRAQILGGKCWATPVLANGRLYVRNAKGDLVCLNLGAK